MPEFTLEDFRQAELEDDFRDQQIEMQMHNLETFIEYHIDNNSTMDDMKKSCEHYGHDYLEVIQSL